MSRIGNREIEAATAWFLIGGCYGLALCVFAFFAAGGGHGSYAPFAVFSSPWGVFGETAAILGAIPLWSSIAAILALGIHPRFRALLVGCMVSHYAGLPVLLTRGAPFDDWDRSGRMVSGGLEISVLIYLAGQAYLWWRFCRDAAKGRDRSRRFQFTLKNLSAAMVLIALPVACFVAPNPIAKLASPYVAGAAAGLGFLAFQASGSRMAG